MGIKLLFSLKIFYLSDLIHDLQRNPIVLKIWTGVEIVENETGAEREKTLIESEDEHQSGTGKETGNLFNSCVCSDPIQS